MFLILRFVAIAAAVYLTVNLVPGVTIAGGWTTLLFVSLVWSVIITVIKPVLSILSLPITILTLGLFSLILNALLFWGMELIVPGFDVAGFWPALLGSIVLSILTWLIEKAFN
ncbi:MAG TPA: phage holin family protein [Candidatus Paceibacterota bacterium]|nr:phage holin family protein [Candidatus Paceibacterota bacterium]